MGWLAQGKPPPSPNGNHDSDAPPPQGGQPEPRARGRAFLISVLSRLGQCTPELARTPDDPTCPQAGGAIRLDVETPPSLFA